MIQEALLDSKLFSTCLTTMWLYVVVNETVVFKLKLSHELLAAFIAFVVFFTSVDFLMSP